MKININSKNKDISVKEYIFRKKSCYSHEKEENVFREHFEATLKDKESSDHYIQCSIRYYGANDEFLGFDQSSVWCRDNSDTRYISMEVTIPENIQSVNIEIEKVKDPVICKKDLVSYLAAIIFISALFFIAYRIR